MHGMLLHHWMYPARPLPETLFGKVVVEFVQVIFLFLVFFTVLFVLLWHHETTIHFHLIVVGSLISSHMSDVIVFTLLWHLTYQKKVTCHKLLKSKVVNFGGVNNKSLSSKKVILMDLQSKSSRMVTIKWLYSNGKSLIKCF